MNFFEYWDNRNARKYAYKMMMHHRGLGDKVRKKMETIPYMNWDHATKLGVLKSFLSEEKIHDANALEYELELKKLLHP